MILFYTRARDLDIHKDSIFPELTGIYIQKKP